MPIRGLQIIYDGQCPFCASYVALVRLREAVGRVEMIDARTPHPLVDAVHARRLDLNSGMVVHHGGCFYHGAEAMHLLATLSAPSGLGNRVQRWIFRSPRLAALLYPVLSAGRRVALRLLGRKPIGAPEHRHPPG